MNRKLSPFLLLAALLAPAAPVRASGPTRAAVLHDFPCSNFGTLGCQLAALRGPQILAMPVILGGFSGGGSSISPGVFTAGGIVLTSATAPASTNAYLNYDGSNIVVNAPASKGIVFSQGGGTAITIGAGGNGISNPNWSLQYGGSGFIDLSWLSSGTKLRYTANVADGAAAIAHTFNTATTLANAGAKLASFQNNGTEKAYIAFDGSYVLAANGAALKAVSPDNTLDFIGGAGSAGQDLRFFLSNGSTIPMRMGAVHANFTDQDAQINVSHIAGASGVPTAATAGGGCGTSSAPTVSGNDIFVTLGVTCGATGTASTAVISATWSHAYTGTVRCLWLPANAATAAVAVAQQVFDASTTAGPSIKSNTTALVAGTYQWNGVCSQQ